MRRYITFILIFLAGLSVSVSAQKRNQAYEDYIKKYRGIAVEEMKKYRIPASITLAQGLLESGAGRSTLARKSNNHFGIKCGSSWDGRTVRHDDDRRNECFRAYRHARESYEDHSKFLALRPRYASLFRLDIRDYKGWAKGLQKCGYATDRKYANKLIKVIEEYKLYEYDSSKKKKREKKDEPIVQHTIYRANGLLYVHAKPGDTLEKIAKSVGKSARKLSKYNEIPKDFPLQPGDIVYLEKKKKKADKPHYEHIVQIGESMHSISQIYGIQVKSLYKINKKADDYIPEEGDVLRLR